MKQRLPRTQLAFNFDGEHAAEQQLPTHECPGYDFGHPCHYLERGCGGIPIPFEQILPPSPSPHHAPIKLPANPAKRAARLRTIYEDEQRELGHCKARYEEICDKGVDALSWYDREIAYGGDLELAWAGAVSLAYNHIVSCLGRLAWLRRELGIDHTE